MIVRILVGLGLVALLFAPLERWWPVHRRPGGARPGTATDLAHFTVTSVLAQVAGLVAVVPVVVAARVLVPDAVPDAIGALPTAAQFGAALVVGELGFYWGHRLAHTLPWWWRLHRVHHSSERLDWLAAARLHPLDQALVRAVAAAPLLALGFAAGPFAGFVVVTQLAAIGVHANVRLRLGPARWLVVSPQFHHWHHAADRVDVNFAGLLPVVDRIFGTAHLPARAWPSGYGADRPAPRGWWAQLRWPFTAAASATTGGSG